ncbi:MAG: UDP-N-acetylmuramoyl-L-alanine--D-glutamate ligase [Chloroherpetonaceae bacterium]|nr:UDP-N-acetylmuramoyl-L-alanine--D-glutamate ligase [Chloroherpetonaceae bacterium]
MKVRGERWVVLGAEKSGIAAAKLLARNGASVLLSEKKPLDLIGVSDEKRGGMRLNEELNDFGIATEFGGHSNQVLEFDKCVISPGIASSVAIVKELELRGCRIISEIELAARFCKAKIVAITGTDGKTTTTTLTAKILSNAGNEKGFKAMALGNIGEAFSNHAEKLTEKDVAVVETSSFQLDHCYSYKPAVSVITNITPNHLDRYDNNFQKYAASKYRIFQAQDENDVLIYSEDSETLSQHIAALRAEGKLKVKAIPFSLKKDLSKDYADCGFLKDGELTVCINGFQEPIIKEDVILNSVHFRGKHNAYNSLAAAIASRALEVRKEVIRESIKTFEGVEHRIEFVREVGGVRFVNDSKATTVNAMWYALDTIPDGIVLIAGGRDKGNDYSKVFDLVRQKVKAIVAIGESKEKIINAFSGITEVFSADSFDEAILISSRKAAEGDTVLLSPACASFDMFANFEERGSIFKRIVNALPEAVKA